MNVVPHQPCFCSFLRYAARILCTTLPVLALLSPPSHFCSTLFVAYTLAAGVVPIYFTRTVPFLLVPASPSWIVDPGSTHAHSPDPHLNLLITDFARAITPRFRTRIVHGMPMLLFSRFSIKVEFPLSIYVLSLQPVFLPTGVVGYLFFTQLSVSYFL